MRAGMLRETIDLLELQSIKDETGGITREYVPFRSVRATKRKLSASVGDAVNASEEFIENTIVLQTRFYSFINGKMRIRFKGVDYNIVLLDHQRADNSYLITCKKVNL